MLPAAHMSVDAEGLTQINWGRTPKKRKKERKKDNCRLTSIGKCLSFLLATLLVGVFVAKALSVVACGTYCTKERHLPIL